MPASTMYCVNCVVLPEPVSPTTISIEFSRIALISTSRMAYTGKLRRCSWIDRLLRGGCFAARAGGAGVLAATAVGLSARTSLERR